MLNLKELAETEVSADEIKRALKCPSNFGFSGREEMFDTWALGPVIVTRDSTLLDQSNAHAIKALLNSDESLADDWEITQCSHWACGWVDHLSYRVVDDKGEPTRIARIVRGWFDYLKNEYPIADESDYSQRECDATFDNVKEAGRRFVKEGAPDTWVSLCLDWFDANDSSALESRDDQGGYPSVEQMKAALAAIDCLDSEA